MEAGSSIERREEQPSKANSSMTVTESGIVRVPRDDQRMKVFLSMMFTESGIVSDTRDEQS